MRICSHPDIDKLITTLGTCHDSFGESQYKDVILIIYGFPDCVLYNRICIPEKDGLYTETYVTEWAQRYA